MPNEQTLKEISKILWGILPPDIYQSGLSTYPFMWQYQVSQEIYKELLHEINKLDFSIRNLLSKDIEGYITQTTNVARVIALVISEWYKRESHGLDGDGAMGIFTNEKMPSPVKIWDAAGFDESLLHKAKKARLSQTAMCVLGGFPLNYVNNKEERFEELINTLSEDDDERNKYSWDELFDDNNSVFSGSLKCGSCKEYLDALWHYLESEDTSFLPFNDKDLGEEQFNKFCKLIKTGYDKKLRKDFFKETHFIYTADDDYSLQNQLRIQIGFKKDNHILYAAQLEKLGIGIDVERTDKLTLLLKAVYLDNSLVRSSPVYFNRIGNHRNDFVSTGISPLSIDYDIFNIKEIQLILLSRTNEERCIRTYPIEPSFELYKTPVAYCWTTRKNSLAEKAVLLEYSAFQDYRDYPVIEKRSEQFDAKRPIWNWIFQNSPVTLTDNDGKIHTFEYGNIPPLQVSFSDSRLEKDLRASDCMVEYVSLDGQGKIRLLLGKVTSSGNDFNLSIIQLSKGKLNKSNRFKLEYKSAGSYRYTEWTEWSQPKQGFISIRVSSVGIYRQPYLADVYYIPAKYPVTRHLDINQITFENVTDVCAYCPSLGHYAPLNGNVYSDPPPISINEPISDTIVFRIGSDEYINLHTYRAFSMQELIKDNVPFKQFFSGGKKEIPVLFHKHIKFRTINEEGCKITEVNNLPSLMASPFPENGYLSHPNSLCTSFPLNEAIDFYIYKTMSINGTQLYTKVSPHHYKEYRFYFWDGYRNHTPELIPSSYDFNSGNIVIDCAHCNSERGVVFQSLKDCNPNNYYRPYYIRRDTGLKNTISPHSGLMYSLEDILFAYDLFLEHQVFAAVFSPLFELRNRRDRQKGLLEYALKKSNYSFTKRDIEQLRRIASEVEFEWMLIPRNDILEIIRRSGSNNSSCIESLRKLFECSPIVKRNSEDNRYEKYYFKRIFVDDKNYFTSSIPFNLVFSSTKYKQKGEARKFIELIKGQSPYNPDEVRHFIRKSSDYTEYIKLYHDIFYQYVIKN